jgi:hypothetical protein
MYQGHSIPDIGFIVFSLEAEHGCRLGVLISREI